MIGIGVQGLQRRGFGPAVPTSPSKNAAKHFLAVLVAGVPEFQVLLDLGVILSTAQQCCNKVFSPSNQVDAVLSLDGSAVGFGGSGSAPR